MLWCGGAIAMAGRGIDLTDESFYLLSYRWWDSTPRAFTGVQYLYGPIFEVVGYDVARLRLFRLITVLVAHLWFAHAFLGWLDHYRPNALEGAWRWAARLAIVASGGVTYGWMPLSPGYNDVAALGSMAMLGCVLSAATTARRTGRLTIFPAIAFGPLAVALVLAKWASAGLILVFVAGVGIVVARSLDARGQVRFALAGAVSTVVSLLGVGILVGGYGEVLPQLLEVNRLVARDTNSPISLLGLYLESGLALVLRAVFIVVLAAVPLGVAVLLRRQHWEMGAAALVILAPPTALLAIDPMHLGLPGGGVGKVSTYAACLVAMTILVAGTLALVRDRPTQMGGESVAGRDGRAADVAVIAALLLLPVIQALGTGNSLYYLAVNQFACWTALLVLAAVVVPRRGRALVVSATSCAVAVAATAGFVGLALDPYRTSGFAEADTPVGGVGPLAALRVSASEAGDLEAVRRVMDQAAGGNAPGRSVMAFDELAGLVLLVDGRSVGEAWYSELNPTRSAIGIEDACTDGPPWRDRRPILVFNRPVLATERQALATCGLDLDTDFTSVAIAGFDPSLSIYLPRERVPDE